MPLSCSCDYDYDEEPGLWFYDPAVNDDFEKLETSRRKRCVSCGKLINIGDMCIKFTRHRYPWTEIESKKCCGVEIEDAFCDPPSIPTAPHYHCERCGEIYLNLTAAGYECLSPSENMEDMLNEYHEISGFRRKANE